MFVESQKCCWSTDLSQDKLKPEGIDGICNINKRLFCWIYNKKKLLLHIKQYLYFVMEVFITYYKVAVLKVICSPQIASWYKRLSTLQYLYDLLCINLSRHICSYLKCKEYCIRIVFLMILWIKCCFSLLNKTVKQSEEIMNDVSTRAQTINLPLSKSDEQPHRNKVSISTIQV